MLSNYYQLNLSVLATFIATSIFAASNTLHLPPNSNLPSLFSTPYVVTLSGGQAWENAGVKKTLNLAPEITKTYTANNTTHGLGDGEIFIGIQHDLPKELLGQIGLAFAATGNAILSGDIWDDMDPAFDNYTYQYKVNHTHVALKGKLLGNWDWPVLPWLSASMGIGFNNAYDFNNTPIITEAVANSNFASKTTTTFTYTVGIGLQRNLTKNWSIGVSYEFADWGQCELGTAQGQTTQNGISIPHFYTNNFLLNLTYIA